jgi:prepilin-type N-terminal cleavage/methylation domain-containing protein
MQSTQRGLTLIELIITIAILGITTAMGVPMFNEARTRAEVRSVAGEIVSSLRWGRSEAMRTNQTAIVRVGPGAVCADATAASLAVQVGGQIVRCIPVAQFAQRFPKIAALTAQTVTFNARGIVPNPVSGYAVSSTSSSATRTINVELSGRVNEAG